ncbi:DUF6783 domain-containing protein [Blautia sp. MSJ-9]
MGYDNRIRTKYIAKWACRLRECFFRHALMCRHVNS